MHFVQNAEAYNYIIYKKRPKITRPQMKYQKIPDNFSKNDAKKTVKADVMVVNTTS